MSEEDAPNDIMMTQKQYNNEKMYCFLFRVMDRLERPKIRVGGSVDSRWHRCHTRSVLLASLPTRNSVVFIACWQVCHVEVCIRE